MDASPESTPVLDYSSGEVVPSMSRSAVIILSLALPGSASLLLMGRHRAGWAALLLGISGGGWLIYFVLCSFLYPRTTLNEDLLGPMIDLSAFAVVAGMIRGLRDRRRGVRATVAIFEGVSLVVTLRGIFVRNNAH